MTERRIRGAADDGGVSGVCHVLTPRNSPAHLSTSLIFSERPNATLLTPGDSAQTVPRGYRCVVSRVWYSIRDVLLARHDRAAPTPAEGWCGADVAARTRHAAAAGRREPCRPLRRTPDRRSRPGRRDGAAAFSDRRAGDGCAHVRRDDRLCDCDGNRAGVRYAGTRFAAERGR